MGETKSLRSKRSIARVRHGHTSREINGAKYSPTYQSWCAMRARCRLEGRENTGRYRDRGISICERWTSFDNFLSDMGERPSGTTLDRLDNNKGYFRDNCRWSTPREQARNTRRNKLTLETATEVALLRLAGISCKAIAQQFGISESLPREIAKGRTWPDALEAANATLERGNG